MCLYSTTQIVSNLQFLIGMGMLGVWKRSRFIDGIDLKLWYSTNDCHESEEEQSINVSVNIEDIINLEEQLVLRPEDNEITKHPEQDIGHVVSILVEPFER